MASWAALAAVALLMSAVLTGVVRRFALTRGILDLPNDRSLHATATPRGGGIAVVATNTLGTLLLFLTGQLRGGPALAVVVGGLAIAAVGYIDDRHKLAAGARLQVHLAAALWAVACVGGLGPLQLGAHVAQLGWAGVGLAVLGIVWVVNLFNFMDGIDGVAASEALFVGAAAALIGFDHGSEVAAAAWLFAWACAGYLAWNWPPARVFLGDVGSGYLGYVIIVLAVADTQEHPAALWVWLILGGVFVVDATFTLMRRLLRGERVYQAHRQHAYQQLARRWGHRPVTSIVLIVNLLWLFPCAMLAARRPAIAAATVVFALAPLLLVVALVGAGRRESNP